MENIIIGAGMAGLITACAIQDWPIYESALRPNETHKAVLRFRDESVSKLTGIPFRAVTVRKGIFFYGEYHEACTPALANLYARKVTGRITGERSIWNLDTATRYIAPEDFYWQLVERHEKRINWGKKIAKIADGTANVTVSTAPMPAMMSICGVSTVADVAMSMKAAPIDVIRYRLPEGTDVFQTIYFPQRDVRCYRASITGGLLIVERVQLPAESRPRYPESVELGYILSAFGLEAQDATEIERVDQRYGKITDIPRDQREAILYELTHRFNVFSIGRFATWRNILLDDVVKDIGVVQRLITSSSYNRRLIAAK